jgi:hypothetical protein
MIIRESIRRKQPLPERIADAPRLRPGLDLFWEAFQALTSCRSVSGFGPPSRIPWTAIDRYSERHGHSYDLALSMVEILGEMDEAYLYFVAKKMKEDQGSS